MWQTWLCPSILGRDGELRKKIWKKEGKVLATSPKILNLLIVVIVVLVPNMHVNYTNLPSCSFVCMLYAGKSELTSSNPNRTFKVSEIVKKWFYQFSALLFVSVA